MPQRYGVRVPPSDKQTNPCRTAGLRQPLKKRRKLSRQNLKKRSVMATVTKENIGLLHETHRELEKTDYLPSFEKSPEGLQQKQTSGSGRNGSSEPDQKNDGPRCLPMKSYVRLTGNWSSYLERDKLDIFANPSPGCRLPPTGCQPADYTFHFEVGMKPGLISPTSAKPDGLCGSCDR